MKRSNWDMMRYVMLIDLIGRGVTVRSRMYVCTGINYAVLTQTLKKLEEMGYVEHIIVVSTGVNPLAYHLTDKGVRFFKVINEFDDILSKNINMWKTLFI